MKLCLARDERRDQRGTNAAPDVAHEADESGDTVALFGRQTEIRDQDDGYEQERHSCHLDHSQQAGAPEADLEIEVPGGVEQRRRGHEPAGRDDVACRKLRRERADDGHHDQQQETAAGQHQACRLGRVAHEQLQILRHHHQAGKHHDAGHEHHRVGAEEVEIPEKAHVDDGIVVETTPRSPATRDPQRRGRPA